jgi:uncharacterized membrane protein
VSKNRLEAFSDGVIAIIITIMVLEFKVPQDTGWTALAPLVPSFLSYLLSFVMVGIYWNNHHHMVHSARSVDGLVLWANLHLLFWLSLLPFTTAWVGEHEFAKVPVVCQGIDFLGAGTAYFLLAKALARHHGHNSGFSQALGSDLKGMLSVVLYLTGIGLAFVHPWLGFGAYVLVAGVWFVPDRRFERPGTGVSTRSD